MNPFQGGWPPRFSPLNSEEGPRTEAIGTKPRRSTANGFSPLNNEESPRTERSTGASYQNFEGFSPLNNEEGPRTSSQPSWLRSTTRFSPLNNEEGPRTAWNAFTSQQRS